MQKNHPVLNLPNILTLIRVVAIPVLVVVFYLPFKWSDMVAAGLFLAAGITDWLDGYLARKLNQTSPFGAFLDPVADKLIVGVALVVLVQVHATAWLAVPAMVIVSREITVSALREWMAELGQRAKVAVSQLGKIKTVTQMTAITLLLAQKPEFDLLGDIIMTPWLWLSYGLLYLATALTLWSMMSYLRAAAPQLLKSQSKS
ncbi:CDP-diacylglycerol--glycerol-3-phosphate 3-phosphatidyltransferase [Alcanivorax sp. S6407]|uniref:CDP-diacylglycerol--glycerol-3-phosphate 3-phosphatidyltransferase n=1 Tax=Alcanivorax sp. S6407 TaxID=2926424 RepID=UPI001FF29B3F|nr:CDP-diacylglycerol--glycerol-3-phosphate 3-phosphatidyltransferase [Alcanivorax sp. S6407]MCK0152423.1 CDP-diacylglycerol--glycerol-3-phosphate 3-phosphatidyltransferase [Alcanivorax sp. S6407]